MNFNMNPVTSNPHPLDDRGPLLQGVTVALLSLALTSFSLRVYVRAYMIKAFGMDDWLMFAAAITFSLYCACVLAGVHYGTGRHLKDLSTSDAQRALIYWFFCYIGYCWTMILSKASIGVFLLRIVTDCTYVWILRGAMVLSVLTGLTYFFVTTFQCHPISYFWDKTPPAVGSCIPIGIITGLGYLYSVLNILCDFTFALLPIIIVRNLNMPRRLKMVTVPLLSMGCFASAGVVVRLAYIETLRDPDFLYATVDVAIWSTVEAGLAITAASFACTRPLFNLLFHRLEDSSAIKSGSVESRGVHRRTHFAEASGYDGARRTAVFGLGSLVSCSELEGGDLKGIQHNDSYELSMAKYHCPLGGSLGVEEKEEPRDSSFSTEEGTSRGRGSGSCQSE